MTVKELIKYLERYDENIPVRFAANERVLSLKEENIVLDALMGDVVIAEVPF